ncbi:MAG: hypothetical protein EXR85_00890 [Xanthomonadales bacterium]|nr:hypothetical protein [Xanthomonadales bacterium]
MTSATTPENLAAAIADRQLSATGEKVASRLGQVSWAVYECARSPYLSLVTIYVFAPYFTNTVIGDPIRGQGMWSFANTIAGFLVAILAPLTGAMADRPVVGHAGRPRWLARRLDPHVHRHPGNGLFLW